MNAVDTVTAMLRHSDEGDFEAFRMLLDRGCEWVNPVVSAHGAEEIAENVAGFMGAFPQRRHVVSLLIESGEHIALEGEWIATHESGRDVRTPFAAIMRVRHGRVTAVRLYADSAALAAQLEAPVVA